MTQNRSTAVMARRHEALDSLDDFPTQPWGTRALCELVDPWLMCGLKDKRVWEPAANRGYMARPLAEYFGEVVATDCHDYGVGYPVHDFLMPFLPEALGERRPEWIITNPPFNYALRFVERGLQVATEGVAILVRTAWLEGIERYERLFSQAHKPARVAQFVERLPLVRGRVDPGCSTATAYMWFIFTAAPCGHETLMGWIPPCRKRLERAGDYDAIGEVAA